jgi:hypothetical protein
VVFLDPRVFADRTPAGSRPAAEQYAATTMADTAWLPLARKGTLTPQDLVSGCYRACRRAKRHPVFDGLPSGGMMDYLVFRNVLSVTALSQDYAVNLGLLQRPRSAPLDPPAEVNGGHWKPPMESPHQQEGSRA